MHLKNSNLPESATSLPTNSLERGLAVMRMIGRKRGGLTHAEISHGLDIPKSTCTYILKRLEREGFVLRNQATGRYKIGVDLLPLARNALVEINLPAATKLVLRELAKSTALAAILVVRTGQRAVAIEFVDGSSLAALPPESSSREQRTAGEQDGVGTEYPLNSSAPGKVLLAYSRQKNTASARGTGAPSNPGAAVSGVPRDESQMSELEQIRERGYAIRERRFALDPFSIAAPVFDNKGNVWAALCIQESVLRPANRDVAGWIALLKKASQEISQPAGMSFPDRAPGDRTESLAASGSGAFSRRTERAFPPQSVNHAAIRPAYAVAHRGHVLGAN